MDSFHPRNPWSTEKPQKKAKKKKKRAFWEIIEKPDIQDQESTHRKIFFVVNIENY